MGTLINHHAMYRQSGERAGRALSRKDYTLCQRECDWFRRALAREPADRRAEVQEVWDTAYKAVAGP